MKIKTLYLILCLTVMVGCTPGPIVDGVEQHVQSNDDYIMTNIWYDGDIRFFTLIPINSSEQIIKKQLDSATIIYNNLKNLK